MTETEEKTLLDDQLNDVADALVWGIHENNKEYLEDVRVVRDELLRFYRMGAQQTDLIGELTEAHNGVVEVLEARLERLNGENEILRKGLDRIAGMYAEAHLRMSLL